MDILWILFVNVRTCSDVIFIHPWPLLRKSSSSSSNPVDDALHKFACIICILMDEICEEFRIESCMQMEIAASITWNPGDMNIDGCEFSLRYKAHVRDSNVRLRINESSARTTPVASKNDAVYVLKNAQHHNVLESIESRVNSSETQRTVHVLRFCWTLSEYFGQLITYRYWVSLRFPQWITRCYTFPISLEQWSCQWWLVVH